MAPRRPAPKASTGVLNTTNGLPARSTRLSQITIKAEMFKNYAITRDSVLLDTVYFNHLFNNKRWFIKYEDINLVVVNASNRRQGAAIGKGVVRLPLLLC
jgi:hypothetical protein